MESQAGNDFGEEFDELQFLKQSLLVVKLRVEEPKIRIEPSFNELKDLLVHCFMEIISSAEGLPRVRSRH